MLTKHKILKELYQVHILDKKSNLVLYETLMNLDLLRKKVEGKEKDFQAALDFLQKSKEIDVSWGDNTVLISPKGITNFSSGKYKLEHTRRYRERVIFWSKVLGILATTITIIFGIIQLVDYFKN